MQAQRSCLNLAATLIQSVDGPVFELGLGNGRTFDHLRELFPQREIFVFDRKVSAHPDCIPTPSHMLKGDIYETLPQAVQRFGRIVALLHSDIGSADKEANRALADCIRGQLPALMRPGGIVVGNEDLGFAGAEALALPPGVRMGRYFMYRVG